MTRGSLFGRLTVALQVTPVYLVLSTGMLRVSTIEPLAVEVLVTGSLSVEISHTISTTTVKSTALLTVVVQVRVREVPAVRVGGGEDTDTPGVGTVQYSNILCVLILTTHLSL